MNLIRRFILALVLSCGLAPAFAQVPAAVPALPDTERRTSYSISGTTCACAVNFALYGDSTDYQNWLEVFIDGVRYDFNDASHGWTITTPSGSLATLARPITNAVLTFNAVQTGTVQIVGARRPRRASQFNENAGVSARNINQVITDIISQNREIWDKTNDVTGRSILAPPGESLSVMAVAASRANKVLGFDSVGNTQLYTQVTTLAACGNGVALVGDGTNLVCASATSTGGDVPITAINSGNAANAATTATISAILSGCVNCSALMQIQGGATQSANFLASAGLAGGFTYGALGGPATATAKNYSFTTTSNTDSKVRWYNTFDSGSHNQEYYGRNSAGVQKIGAIINPGLSTATAGAEVGDIDFIVYRQGDLFQQAFCMGMTGDLATAGMLPCTDNAYYVGSLSNRWKNIYGVVGTFNSITLPGATSGGTVLIAPATGTPTVTFGTSSGTPAVTASAPLAITAATGNITCATCTTSGITSLTGDVTATGPGAAAATLATVNANTGSWGTATAAPQFTVNGKGLITAAANVTITPAVGSITGLGTGVATALALNVGSAGAPVTFNGAGGTPSSLTLTNATGLPTTGLTGTLQAAQEPAHTGDVTNSAGSLALSIANNAVTLAKLATQTTNTVLGNATSGSAVPTALTMTTCSTAASALIWTTNTGFGCNTSITAGGVPVGGITGLGTGVATALAIAVGSAGGPVTFNGAGGTPSSLTGTNISGTASSLTAGNATNTAITDDTTTNATMFPTWVTTSSSNQAQKVSSSKLTFNPSTGTLSSTVFSGSGASLTNLPNKQQTTFGNLVAGLVAGATVFIGPGGGSAGEITSQTTAPIAMTISRLYAHFNVSPGGGQTYTVTMRKNGADAGTPSTLSCTASASTECTPDTTNSVSLAAGDLYSFKIVASAGAATSGGHSVSFQSTTTSP